MSILFISETKKSKISLKTKIENLKKKLSISETTHTVQVEKIRSEEKNSESVPPKTRDVEPKRSMRQRNLDKTSSKNKKETAEPSTSTELPEVGDPPSSTKRKRRSIKLYNPSDDENLNTPLEHEKVCTVQQQDEVPSPAADRKEVSLADKKGPPKKKTKGKVLKNADNVSKEQKDVGDDKLDDVNVSKTDIRAKDVLGQTDQIIVQKEQSEKIVTKNLYKEPKIPPKEAVVAVENKGNDAIDNKNMKEICMRCKTVIDIPDPSNALDSILQHCENCPKVLMKSILPCPKCLFASKFKEEFRAHINNHLIEDAKKKVPEGELKQKLLQELPKQKRGALQDKRSDVNIGKTSAPPKPDAEKEPLENKGRKIATVSDQDVPIGDAKKSILNFSCIHCGKSIYIKDPCRPMSCLIYHSLNCPKKAKEKDIISCYHCNLKFISINDLKNHISNLQTKADKQIPQAPPIQTPLLKKMGTTGTKDVPRKFAPINTSTKKTKGFKCRHCNEELASENALHMHMITHRVH